MCGRYAMELSVDELVKALARVGLDVAEVKQDGDTACGLNIAPQSHVLVYCHEADPKSSPAQPQTQAKPALVRMRWTLQPSFAQKPVSYPTFNTRSDSLSPLKPAFRCAEHRRGIVFMQGYYEWQHDAKTRLPFYFSSADTPVLCCLVIWDTNAHFGATFSIVTTEAVPNLRSVHDRMPVIVDADTARKWVTGSWPSVLDLLKPNVPLKHYRVATDVNRVGAKGRTLNKPLKSLDSWFAPKTSPKHNKASPKPSKAPPKPNKAPPKAK